MSVVPTEIRQAGPDALAIDWSDGETSLFAVRALRLACPCAECVDEMTGKKLLVDARVPPDVKPVRITSVGNYALKISWSDGHDTGIYSWKLLRGLWKSTEAVD